METASREGDAEGEHKDGATVGVDMTSLNTLIKECASKTEAVIADSIPYRSIINPDPTAKTVNSAFYGIYPRLLPILQRDNVRDFLSFFQKNMWAMTWDFITPQTVLHMILEDSLRCAKVVLEGQAPELNGHRAYPNCATQYGFFPLHQAAEIFSVDMIKLLLQHGASANVRTCGSLVIDGLLPLHVAVENTCMHKYLDDNLFPDELRPNYCKADTKDVYKLIHLLCLPEMKIFLDTTKLLAGHTNDLIGEICNYIRDGKLVETAVLLLAAQDHIRGNGSSKKNGNSKPNGFSYIVKYIAENTSAVKLEMGHNEKEHEQLKEKYISTMLWLVEAISVAGESLGTFIQKHSKVPREKVLEYVSSILKSYDFCPTGEGISIGSLNLSPYKLPLPKGVIPNEHGDIVVSKVPAETPRSCAGKKMAVVKRVPRGLDLKYKRKSFFPFWRSALASGCPVRIYPRHALDDKHNRDMKALSMMGKESSSTPNHDIGPLASMAQSTSNYQLKRAFGTAASTSNYQSTKLFGTAALTLLKVLKKA